MLRVGMQVVVVALRADILKAKLAWQISVPQLVDTPNLIFHIRNDGLWGFEA